MRLAGAIAALAAVVGLVAGPAGSARRDPARVQIVAKEYQLLPSRYVLPAGPAIVELVNAGEDAHDLALRRHVPGARTIHMPVVQSGALARISVRLFKGRYDVWCTLPNHKALGMQTRLVVR